MSVASNPPPAANTPAQPTPAPENFGVDKTTYEFAMLGPLAFGLLIVLQGMLTLIFLFGPNDKAKPAGLIGEGVQLSRPERDIPLFVAGSIVAVVAMSACVTVWNRLARSVNPPMRPKLLKSSSITLAFLGIGSFVYYTIMLGWKFLPPHDGSATLRTPVEWIDPWLLGLPAVLAILCAAWELMDQRNQLAGIKTPSLRINNLGRAAIHGLIALLIILSIYIPRATWPELAGSFFLPDWMHHWNFFGMGSALKWAHGEAFHRDFYAQYGMGWPVLFVFLSRWLPLSYANMLGEGIAAAAIYYCGLYLLLIQLFRKPSWAIIGVLFCLAWQIYIEQNALIWQTPSSTVLRDPIDVFCFGLLLRHRLTGKHFWFFLTGAAAGLAFFFEIDTGIYLIVTLAFYSLVCFIVPAAYGKDHPLRRQCVAVISLLAGFAALLIPLFYICSRGSLFQADFWKKSLEAVDSSTVAGISMLPIAELTTDQVLFFVAQITLYLLAIGFALYRIFQRHISDRVLVLACIAVYGMGCILLFVGRSHPFNLYHPTVPFAILLVGALYAATQYLHRSMQIRLTSFAPALAAAVLLFLVTSTEFLSYPSALVQSLFGHTTPKGITVFPALNDLAAVPRESVKGPSADFINDIRQVSDKAKKLSTSHDRVVFLDFLDTTLYYGSDIDPWSRYPALFRSILTEDFLHQVEAQLLEEHPRFVFIRGVGLDLGPNEDVWESLYDFVRTHYTWRQKVGSFNLYEYVPPPTTSDSR